MERWRAALKKLLFPGWGWVALAVLLGGASLAAAFLVFGEGSPFAYAAYLLSAYALAVLSAAVMALFPAIHRTVRRLPLVRRCMADRYFKVRSTLALSLFANLCYAGFKLACAARYASFWDGALAVYYILLCAVRFYLLRRVPQDARERDMGRELRHYRATGIFLLLLDLALSAIATQIVRDGYGSSYPGMLIYAAALHAFCSLAVAIVNTVKYRRHRSPVLSAAKAVSLTTALVSIFNLETAMIAQFGAGQAHFRLAMTSCTAFALCAAILGAAAYMVVSANRKLRRLSA